MNKRPAYVYRYHCSKPFLWFGSPSLHSWWLQPWCHGHHPCPASTSEHVWTDGCHEPLRTRQMAQGPSRGRPVHPQGSNFCLLFLGLNPSVSVATASKLGIEHCRPKLPAAHRCCPAVHRNNIVMIWSKSISTNIHQYNQASPVNSESYFHTPLAAPFRPLWTRQSDQASRYQRQSGRTQRQIG